ncbi:hypothetical protein LTR36_003837 [Oleoguttula mirabilis]|uniref:Uncharacterized protein n=1 Tax=Oleoguttula mirabilis TaxID=1507867 RepID=A0AAV9JIY0_9PEZI|nr:hypothetical protein LTR36_003837 [Oleoguttula mirabilis]
MPCKTVLHTTPVSSASLHPNEDESPDHLMCTQQLIWCSCGHGEFLPIEKCSRATTVGYCWTVIWGDHNVVIPSRCSYCKAGLNAKGPLGSAWPVGELATSAGRSFQVNAKAESSRSAGTKTTSGELTTPLRKTTSATEEVAKVEGSCFDPELDGGQPVEPYVDGSPQFLPGTELPTPPFELDDVLGTDFGAGFDLSQEMWQYA